MDYYTYMYHYYMQPYYHQQIYNQSQQPQQPVQPVQPNNKKTQLSVINENGKIICKKMLTCIKGMKCTNIHCTDYHHPKVDLDIMRSHHDDQK